MSGDGRRVISVRFLFCLVPRRDWIRNTQLYVPDNLTTHAHSQHSRAVPVAVWFRKPFMIVSGLLAALVLFACFHRGWWVLCRPAVYKVLDKSLSLRDRTSLQVLSALELRRHCTFGKTCVVLSADLKSRSVIVHSSRTVPLDMVVFKSTSHCCSGPLSPDYMLHP